MSRKVLFSRMRHSYFFMTGFVCLCLIFVAIYILPLLSDWNPVANSLVDRFTPPEGFSKGFQGHIFGTDQLGRDLFIRLFTGIKYSFYLAFITTLLNLIIGSALGTFAGYFGKWVDTLIMRLCEAVLAMPTLIMAIAIMAVLGPSTRNLIIVLCISGWVQICKVTRNNVRVAKQQEFVLASKALGAKGFHIMFNQIFPNVTTSIIVLTSQRVGVVILMESTLSYLNMGIQDPAPSLGNLISNGRIYLATQPWLILVPGIALMLVVLSCNFLGDGLRDVLDTKRKI